MLKRNESREGFTLLEVVFVMFLAVVLLLGLLSTSVATRNSRNFNRERDIAREAARAQMEQILDTPFAALALGTTNFDVNLGTVEELKSSVPGEQPGEIIIADTPAPASATLLRVTVRVRWIGYDGKANNIFELNSYVVDKEP